MTTVAAVALLAEAALAHGWCWPGWLGWAAGGALLTGGAVGMAADRGTPEAERVPGLPEDGEPLRHDEQIVLRDIEHHLTRDRRRVAPRRRKTARKLSERARR